MGFKYQGDSTIGVSLTVQTPKPLDTRLVVDTRADLYSIPAKYAYNGMPVVCVTDGNIYTLIDKNKIGEAVGWKASYESIQIITCTEQEYKKWQDNTNSDFTPKDDSQTWLHQDTYYYIYEESISDKGQYYVSYTQFEDLTNQVNKKATISALNSLSEKTDKALQDLAKVYATLNDIDSSNPESKLSKTLDNYYTKQKVDDTFVTKDSLRGDGIEGDNFVFVTKSQYDADQQTLNQYKEDTANQINTKVTTGSEAQLKSITNEGTTLSIGQQVAINGKKVALDKDVPKIIVLTQEEYDNLENKEIGIYYMTYGSTNSDSGIITSDLLIKNYYTQKQVIDIIKDVVNQLCTKNNLQFDYIHSIEVDKPIDQTFEYDGNTHTLASTNYYDVIGEGGSEPGNYRFKVILKPGKWWKDGTNTPIFVTYTINQNTKQ